MTTATASSTIDVHRYRTWVPWIGLLVGAVILQIVFRAWDQFPAALDTFFSDPIDRAAAWGRTNRQTHILFTGFFTPITRGLEGAMGGVESFLIWLPWYVLPATVFLVVARTRPLAEAITAFLAAIYPGVIGLWEVTMDTLALMVIAVLVAAVVGIPLGVWAAFRPRVETAIRPLLDIMQTVPAFIYFLPLLLLFGVGRVNGAVATIIYALPPVVRLTTLGIRQVPQQSVEASRMFGASTRQTLFKVQLPSAVPSIMAGLNQTIMMALGIVVLASLVGAGGLGGLVLQTLSQRRTGRGIATGLAIVAVAMVLDRIGRAIVSADPTKRRFDRRTAWAVVSAIGVAIVVGRLAGWAEFPQLLTTRAFDPIDTGVIWARDNLSWFTRPVNDFIVADVIVPVRNTLTDSLAWPVLVLITGFIGWRLKGWGLAAFGALSITYIGLIGMWDLSLDTLTQVMAAVLISVAVALPIGIAAGRSERVEAAIGPILDALQTIPSLVYIIPVVILFTVGVVPGIIASVLYAIVPGIRIVALGIRQVPKESLEASEVFGASARQTMLGVRVPLAAPTMMAGVNQIIMMVLAMVIIAGLVGGGALGFKTIEALTRSDNGLGFEVGVSIAFMAMILDRFTEAWADRLRPPAATP
ncbi:MAG: ABC transporter permease subunit [Acidimicrobiia bacterium]|nr:ABC transporter permease subunit [Acidimicrobiia bacterium]